MTVIPMTDLEFDSQDETNASSLFDLGQIFRPTETLNEIGEPVLTFEPFGDPIPCGLTIPNLRPFERNTGLQVATFDAKVRLPFNTDIHRTDRFAILERRGRPLNPPTLYDVAGVPQPGTGVKVVDLKGVA